jgi:hypothetical protein
MPGMSRRKPRIGRPTGLNPDMQQRITDMIRVGVPIVHATAAAGISRATYFIWINRGQDAADLRDAGQPIPEHEQPYLDFFDAATRARSEAITRAVANVAKAAAGGYPIREIERTYRNAEGKLVTEREVVRAPIEYRAATWYLERADRENFGKSTVDVQLSGPDGGPVQIAATQYESLAQRLRVNMDRAVAQLGAGAVIDGEVEDRAG